MLQKNADNIFCERLKELRGDRSQKEIAELIGVSRATVAFYEDGTRHPNADTLKKMSDLFGVSMDYLTGVTNAKDRNEDIQAMSAYTGLSDQALYKLNQLKRENSESIRVLNYLIEDPYFLLYLADYMKLNPITSEYTVSIKKAIRKNPGKKYDDEWIQETVFSKKLDRNESVYLNDLGTIKISMIDELLKKKINKILEEIRKENYEYPLYEYFAKNDTDYNYNS